MESTNKTTIINSDTYLDPKVLLHIIEEKYGKTIDELKNDIIIKDIFVTEEHIREYLNNKLVEEDPDLKERVENKDKYPKGTFGKLTDDEIKREAQNFMDKLNMQRYSFDSYTLDYFKKCAKIYKDKSISLLDTIKGICTKNIEPVQDTLNELDIVLDTEGNISVGDIDRLVEPTFENISDYNNNIDRANSLYTYLSFKITRDSIHNNGLTEDEVYPVKTLQCIDMLNLRTRGCVAFSDRQYEKLRERYKEAGNKFIKMISDL